MKSSTSPEPSAQPSGQLPGQPPTENPPEDPSFGWSAYAERINGRFAMLGFAAVLLIEAISGDTFLHWAGLVP